MSEEYNIRDYMKLAEILERPYDDSGCWPWNESMKEWVTEFDPEDLTELIINCFFSIYDPPNLEKSELKEILCDLPLFLLGQHLMPEPSIEEPKSIFAEWRLSINK